MSYYFKNPYAFSHHGLLRIKHRLNLIDLNDWELTEYCFKLMQQSQEIIETRSFKYIKANQSDNYFIVQKNNNLVVTMTPIAITKILKILEEDR